MLAARKTVAGGRREFAIVLGMLLLTIVLPLQEKNYSSEPDPLVGQVVWSIAYLAAALRLFSLRRVAGLLFAASAPLLAVVGIALLSTLWSVAPEITLKNAIELLGTTLIGFYIVARFKLRDFLNVLMLFFATSVVASVLLIALSPGRGRMFWGSGAWDGVYQEKNALGAAMVMAIIVYLIHLFSRKAPHKALAALGVIACVTLLAGSNSATALVDCILVLAICTTAVAAVSPAYGGLARILAIAAFGLILAAVSFFGTNTADLFAALGRSQDLTGRTDFWPYLLDAVKARPELGYGYSAFFRSTQAQDYLGYYLVQSGGWTPYHAHNSFIQTLLDTGYLGLTALIVLLLGTLARALRYFFKERTVVSVWPLAMVLFLIFGSYSETYLGNFNTLGWILFVAAFLYPIRELDASFDDGGASLATSAQVRELAFRSNIKAPPTDVGSP